MALEEFQEPSADHPSTEKGEIVDAVGTRMEAAITEPVNACNAVGIPTCASCEGHAEPGHFGAPWIECAAPGEPLDRFNGEQGIYEKIAERHGISADDVRRSEDPEAWAEAQRLIQERGLKETSEYQAWERMTHKLQKGAAALIEEFYHGRDVAPSMRLKLEELPGVFRIHNGGNDYRIIPSDLPDEDRQALQERLVAYRKEMNDFAAFLRHKKRETEHTNVREKQPALALRVDTGNEKKYEGQSIEKTVEETNKKLLLLFQETLPGSEEEKQRIIDIVQQKLSAFHNGKDMFAVHARRFSSQGIQHNFGLEEYLAHIRFELSLREQRKQSFEGSLENAKKHEWTMLRLQYLNDGISSDGTITSATGLKLNKDLVKELQEAGGLGGENKSFVEFIQYVWDTIRGKDTSLDLHTLQGQISPDLFNKIMTAINAHVDLRRPELIAQIDSMDQELPPMWSIVGDAYRMAHGLQKS